VDERHLGGHLISRLEKEDKLSLEVHLDRINQRRSVQRKKSISLVFKATHITRTEKTHGADIGLVLRAELPDEYVLTKAAIIQSKRLHPSEMGNFSNRSSYQELFKRNKESQWDRMLSITSSSAYFLYGPFQIYIKNKYTPLGTCVVSAQKIAGIADQPASTPFFATDAVQMGKSLSKWLVEEFICCNIGDPNKQTINTALGENPNFPITSTLEI